MSAPQDLGWHLAPIAFAGAVPAKFNQAGRAIGEPIFAVIHIGHALGWRVRAATRADLPPNCSILVDRWDGTTLCVELHDAGFDVHDGLVSRNRRREVFGVWQYVRFGGDRDALQALLNAFDFNTFPSVGDLPDLSRAVLLALTLATPRVFGPQQLPGAEGLGQKPGLDIALKASERGGRAATAEIADAGDIGADRSRFGFGNARFPKQDFVTGRFIACGDLARQSRPHADDLESHADDVVEDFGLALQFRKLPLETVQSLGLGFSFHDRSGSDLFSAASSPQRARRCNASAVAR